MAGSSGVPAPRLLPHTNYLQWDHSLDSWVLQIQKAYDSWKKSRTLTDLLHEFYRRSENPYYSACYLMAFSPDLKFSKPTTLAFIAMEEFSGWLNATHNQPDPQLLNSQLKRYAFTHVTSQKHIALIKLVFRLYKLADNNEEFVPDIKDMLRKKMYKEASQVVMLLGLQDNFSVEDFLVPLVFQDVISVVEDYLDATPSVRTALIGYLDNLIEPGGSTVERDNIISQLDIPDVKYQKLHYKPLSKFMVRIMKKYTLPSSCCPNLTNKKSRGALQFIITRKYRDNNIGNESWREMVSETVGSDKELQMELIQSLCAVNDLKEATHWAHNYALPFEELPQDLQQSIQDMNERLMNGSNECDKNEEENWENDALSNTKHFEFPLSTESIIMIDTLEKLQHFAESELSADVKTVGLDAEWKPAFSHSPPVLSLLQIATNDRVFLIDILSLEKNSSVWHQFGSALFTNQNILKLGFSFEGDINMLKENIKVFESLKMSGLGFLDLSMLWNTLTKDWSIKLPYAVPVSSTKNAASLSHLVHLCCGYPLDKADQFSNWEKRPLRDSQKKYAATDAYCLLLVYDTLKECCERQRIPFYDVCDELMTKVTVKKTVNKKKNTKHYVEIQMPPKPNRDPVPVGWMYAMCTNNLEGFGKKLRMLGIDTEIVPPGRSYEESLQMARSEKRIVLATGSVFNRFFNELPPTFCYKVDERLSLEDQIAAVLDYYNIAVKESDIFSRCMVCNFNEFARVESHTMREMMVESARQATAQPSHARPLSSTQSDFVDYAYCDGDGDEDDDDDFQPGPPLHKMHCYQAKPGEIVKAGTCKTTKGVDIQLAEIPMGVVDRVPLFYICEHCGKCYWDGSHLSRVLQSRSQKLISQTSLKSKLNFNQ
ncbi:hypothetical protein LSTR_LSTR002069 [Laodelphax striatellus]|uniref:3'-5' exonuclease domain-containing protein n=1 Tax=Laodelphax striatellus TaxID=195883 RepID=A0A482XPV7_LAOST|nr:hypothetical protein LSTR_LSTR002069 [Laodelphax striatellus]